MPSAMFAIEQCTAGLPETCRSSRSSMPLRTKHPISNRNLLSGCPPFRSSGGEIGQELLEGLISCPAGCRHGFIEDRRTFYRTASPSPIDLPSPWLWRGASVLNDDGKIGLIEGNVHSWQYGSWSEAAGKRHDTQAAAASRPRSKSFIGCDVAM